MGSDGRRGYIYHTAVHPNYRKQGIAKKLVKKSLEALEEIGYKLDLSNVRPSFTINFQNGFNDIYLVEREVEIDALKLQYEEVKEVKWATADEIKYMIESGEFIPYDKSFIDMLFFLRNHNGLHTREDKTF